MTTTSTHSETDVALKDLLQKLDSKSGIEITSNSIDAHISPILSAFRPSAAEDARPLAFLVLSRIFANARKPASKASEAAQEKITKDLAKLFYPAIESRLSTTGLVDVVSALGLFAALFQVDPSTASDIFLRDGLIEVVMDITDLFEGDDGRIVYRAVAGLLSQASGSKVCRPIISSHALIWLQEQVDRSNDAAFRAASAVTLTKLSRGTAEDAEASSDLGGAPGVGGDQAIGKEDDESLARLMKSLVMTPSDGLPASSQGMLDAIEGLAHTSSDPKTKEMLSSDPDFLKKLFALVPPLRKHQTGPVPTVIINSDSLQPSQPKGSLALLFGVAVIIVNIVSFPPQLSEEERHIDRLRKMTKEGARTGNKLAEPAAEGDPLESDAAVKRRCKRMVKAGVVTTLVALSSRSESEGIRRAIAKAFLSVVEDQDTRGKVIQAGGAKALQTIIRASFSALEAEPASTPKPRSKFDSTTGTAASRSLEPPELLAIQALAKLSITSSPLLLFGPDISSSIDVIRPFGHLLLAPSSTLLQKFEALMALTNIASLGPPAASRVAKQKEQGLGSLVTKAETLLLDDNVMVRRAATELICNLISSDEVWERYTGEDEAGKKADIADSTLLNRLRVVLAMADVDDVATRLAASGALAMLGTSGNVRRILLEVMEDGPDKVLRVLMDGFSPEDGDEASEEVPQPTAEQKYQLAYRGVVCVRNLLLSYAAIQPSKEATKKVVESAKKAKLAEAVVVSLSKPENGNNKDMMLAGGELLKWLIGHGVEVVV